MSITVTIAKTLSGAGVQAQNVVTATGEVYVTATPTVAAAKEGTLTTRTDGTSGTLTMGTGHGITTGARMDIYWADGKCYHAVAGTVSGLSVPIASVAGGDALPAANTAVTVSLPEQANLSFVGDDLQVLVVTTGVPGYVTFADGSADRLTVYVTPDAPYMWSINDGASPLATRTPTKAFLSHGKTSAVSSMKAVAVTA